MTTTPVLEASGENVVLVILGEDLAGQFEKTDSEFLSRIRDVNLDDSLQRLALTPRATFASHSLSISPTFAYSDDSGTVQTVFDIEELLVGTSAITTTSLSVGYVLWMLRGGSLIASFVSTLPAWSAFDPLPFVNEMSEQQDSESLSNIVENAGNQDQA